MMAVRGLLLSLAENGVFTTLGYSMQPSPELVKEMDAYYRHLMAFTRTVLREHAEKVHALAAELVAREELDAEEIVAILGPRPQQSDTMAE